MLEVTLLLFLKVFQRLLAKGRFLWPRGSAYVRSRFACVCVCVWSGCLGVLIYRGGPVPGRGSQATRFSSPNLSSAGAACPALTPDTQPLIRLSESRAAPASPYSSLFLSLSSPKGPTKGPTHSSLTNSQKPRLNPFVYLGLFRRQWNESKSLSFESVLWNGEKWWFSDGHLNVACLVSWCILFRTYFLVPELFPLFHNYF